MRELELIKRKSVQIFSEDEWRKKQKVEKD